MFGGRLISLLTWPLLGAPVACSSGSARAIDDRDEAAAARAEPASARFVTPPSCAALLDTIAPVVDEHRAKAHTVDVAVGLITRACPFVGYTSGLSRVKADARYRLASITKTYTGAVILTLASRGLLALDEPISRFGLALPHDDRITIRQLLNHTSGLFNYTEHPAFPSHHDATPEERLRMAAERAPYFAPGEGWHYANTNFLALAAIAERVTTQPMSDLVHTLLLGPQRLSATYFEGAEEVLGSFAPSFASEGRRQPAEDLRFKGCADGGMVSTIEDVTRWTKLYASGRITPMWKTELWSGVKTGRKDEKYGLALEIRTLPTISAEAYGHTGDLPGFHSLSFFVPARDWTVTVIVNTEAGDPSIVFDAVVQKLAEQVVETTDVTPQAARRRTLEWDPAACADGSCTP